MILRWTAHLKKSFKKIPPSKKKILSDTLRDLSNNPFQTHLKTHKLKGDLKECWRVMWNTI